MVFSKGVVFSLLHNSSNEKHLMIYGKIEHINCEISEIELPDQRDLNNTNSHSASCGSSLIVVALMGIGKIADVLIWEFEFDNRIWKSFRIVELMPTSIKNDLKGSYMNDIICWGQGDILCLKASEKVLVYNVKESSLHWLLECSEDWYTHHLVHKAIVYDVAQGLFS